MNSTLGSVVPLAMFKKMVRITSRSMCVCLVHFVYLLSVCDEKSLRAPCSAKWGCSATSQLQSAFCNLSATAKHLSIVLREFQDWILQLEKDIKALCNCLSGHFRNLSATAKPLGIAVLQEFQENFKIEYCSLEKILKLDAIASVDFSLTSMQLPSLSALSYKY